MASKKGEAQDLSRRAAWMIWGVLAVMVVLFVSAFSKAWQTNQALEAELQALRPMATEAVAQRTALETRVAYVQSDEYVEAWSQTRAGMTRSGETLIIPVDATPTPTPQAPVAPTPIPTAMPFLSGLWHSLFGD
ncbi:MAG: septum formation initiator family protein [Anaerolineae bacterium]|jgi:cell division protein FtsB|nr:septum formation initiator family protein [Anaerolineae bacterium]